MGRPEFHALCTALMCGIFCSVVTGSQSKDDSKGVLVELLVNRGPDYHQTCVRTLSCRSGSGSILNNRDIVLTFFSSVLALRGPRIVTQPLCDEHSDSVLCWNGEAWQVGGHALTQDNDAEFVIDLLLKAVTLDHHNANQVNVQNVLASISGPFAFVFWDAKNLRLYFGRDHLGRRSLLVKRTGPVLLLSSVSDGNYGWTEVDGGIFVLQFQQPGSTDNTNEKEHYEELVTGCTKWSASLQVPQLNRSLPPDDYELLHLQSPAVLKLEKLLRDSLSPRLHGIRFRSIPGPTVAILFSGGLDCTVLARLIHDILPINEDIDLLNVAFHNPRIHGLDVGEQRSCTSYDCCPDRITARSALSELSKTCPGRKWRLVEINVPYKEALKHRETIKMLMHPHKTEMDLSIAYALYFASRGSGHAANHENKILESYQTPARVLFSGLGADELFGGYQRHATAFHRHGYTALLDELEVDFNRLGKRNLGRDDRVISHWGKEVRYPYLDEELVAWAIQAPVWEKCGFSLPNAQPEDVCIGPDKRVLRLVAYKLGLGTVSREKKRAIQFGARTAKMEVGRTKGTQLIT